VRKQRQTSNASIAQCNSDVFFTIPTLNPGASKQTKQNKQIKYEKKIENFLGHPVYNIFNVL